MAVDRNKVHTVVILLEHCGREVRNMFRLKGTHDLYQDYDVSMHFFEGRVLAHDVLEHQNGPGCMHLIEDELEALGGLYFVRWESGYMHGKGNTLAVAEYFGNELAYVLWHTHRNLNYVRSRPVTELDTHLEQDLPDILISTERHLREGREDLDGNYVSHILGATRHCFRRGYRKAAKRFGNQGVAHDLFETMEECFNEYMRHYDWEDLPDQEIIMNYTLDGYVEFSEPETRRRGY